MSHFAMKSNIIFSLGRLNLRTNAIDGISHRGMLVCDAFYHWVTAFRSLRTVCTKVRKAFCVGMNELRFKAFVVLK